MAQDSDEVRVVGDGAVYRAPVGTAFPVSPIATPAGAWIDLGYITTDGPRFSFGAEIQRIMAWQEEDPVRSSITGRPKTISFDLLQMNPDAWMTATGGGDITEPVPDSGHFLWTPPDPGVKDEFALLVRGIDSDFHYDLRFPKVSNENGIEFAFTRDDAVKLAITVAVLAPGGGAASVTVLTDDPSFEAA